MPAVSRPAPPAIRFTAQPPAQLEIATPATISWQSDDRQAQYRYKLDVPGEWLAGLRHYLNKWSDWGPPRTVRYSDFVYEGTYTFTVEAKGKNATGSAAVRWKHHFVMPQIMEDALRIDWNKAKAARKQSEKYRILAKEYGDLRKVMMQRYEAEHRALRLTVSPQQLQDSFFKAVVGKELGLLQQWADKAVAASIKKMLLPKLVYDIVKTLGVDVVLVYRNLRANAAAFSTVAAAWAEHGYEQLAKQAEKSGK